MLSRTFSVPPVLALGLILLAGCAGDPPTPAGEDSTDALLTPALTHAHAGDEDVLIARVSSVDGQRVVLEADEPFERIGISLLSNTAPRMTAELTFADGSTSREMVEFTFATGEAHVGRVLLHQSAVSVTLVPNTPIADLFVELGGPFAGDPLRLTRNLPLAEPAHLPKGGTVTPPEFVITRQSWGARYPERICGDPHSPDRITVHHTAGANNDNLTPAQTLQQIQSFHIDTRGWCDIGYHYLIGRDGNVYQGRTWPDRTGAHVGGQNTDNVGVGFLGNFVDYVPPTRMLDAGALVLGWIGDTWNIPLDRERVRGHGERAATLCPGAQLLSRLEAVLEDAGGEPTPSPTTATLIGFVRENDINNSDGNIPGVTVAITGGPTTTSGSNGLYRFDGLDLGNVSATFTRDCFAPATSSRALSSPGEQHWMSVPLIRLQDGDEGPVNCADPYCSHLTACSDTPLPTEPTDPVEPDPTEPPPASGPDDTSPQESDAPGAGTDSAPDTTTGAGPGPPPSNGDGDGRQPPRRPGGSASPGPEFTEFTSSAGCNAAPSRGTQGCAVPWLLLLIAVIALRPRREEFDATA